MERTCTCTCTRTCTWNGGTAGNGGERRGTTGTAGTAGTVRLLGSGSAATCQRGVDYPARVELMVAVVQGFRAMRGEAVSRGRSRREFRAMRHKQAFRPPGRQLAPDCRRPPATTTAQPPRRPPHRQRMRARHAGGRPSDAAHRMVRHLISARRSGASGAQYHPARISVLHSLVTRRTRTASRSRVI